MQNLSMWEYSFILKEGEDVLNQRLKKIYQIGEKKFRFSFGQKSLIINLGKNFYFTKEKEPALREASNFVMFLRKHLQGKKLLSFYQYDFDRYYILEFFPDYKVILEQFGKGNLILLKKERILCFFYMENGLKKDQEFIFPPKKEFDKKIYLGKKYLFLEEAELENIKKEYFVYKNDVWATRSKEVESDQITSFSTFSEAIEFLDKEEEVKKVDKVEEERKRLEQKLQKRLEMQQQNLRKINKEILHLEKLIKYIKENIGQIEYELQKAKEQGKKSITITVPEESDEK